MNNHKGYPNTVYDNRVVAKDSNISKNPDVSYVYEQFFLQFFVSHDVCIYWMLTKHLKYLASEMELEFR